jgi:hypothetical protein
MISARQAELEAAAVKLGFQNAALMAGYFKAKVMAEGLYEVLNVKAARPLPRSSSAMLFRRS